MVHRLGRQQFGEPRIGQRIACFVAGPIELPGGSRAAQGVHRHPVIEPQQFGQRDGIGVVKLVPQRKPAASAFEIPTGEVEAGRCQPRAALQQAVIRRELRQRCRGFGERRRIRCAQRPRQCLEELRSVTEQRSQPCRRRAGGRCPDPLDHQTRSAQAQTDQIPFADPECLERAAGQRERTCAVDDLGRNAKPVQQLLIAGGDQADRRPVGQSLIGRILAECRDRFEVRADREQVEVHFVLGDPAGENATGQHGRKPHPAFVDQLPGGDVDREPQVPEDASGIGRAGVAQVLRDVVYVQRAVLGEDRAE